MLHNTRKDSTRTRPKMTLGFPGITDECEINHCENKFSDEVGIRLCVDHLRKAWAAYELIQGTTIDQFRPKPPDKPAFKDIKGIVYFVQVDKYIKIGWTNHFERRMKDLGATIIYHTEAGSRADEADYHNLFRKYRAKGREYFYPVPVVMNFIKELQTGVAA